MKTSVWKPLSLAARIAALTVVLMFLQGIGASFIPAQEAGQPPPDPSGSFFAIMLLVLLLQTIALAYPVIRSRWNGYVLAATVFLLFFGTVTFQSQLESMIYLGGTRMSRAFRRSASATRQ